MSVDQIISIFIFSFFGALIGFLSMWIYYRVKVGQFKALAQEIISKAEMKAEIVKKNSDLEIKQKQEDMIRRTEEQLHKEKMKLHERDERLKEREDKLERRMSLVEKKLQDIDKREAILQARREQHEEDKKSLSIKQSLVISELERLTGLTSQEAKEELFNKISGEIKNDTSQLIRRAQKQAEEECDRLAAGVISTAINRLALSTVSEGATLTVSIPHDDMKGRIIGRDGRNIRALERLTGVNFLIDETPGVIIISGFDPVRKNIAKQALSDLVSDGRIHPSRIEEAVEKAKASTQKQIRKTGEDAATRAGVINLHPELIDLLGKLKFRYSYGQNVLEHSLEVAYLMRIMASELGLNETMAKRIGLLHDIGKAVTHEVEGTHALIGRDLALKFDESEEIANGIGCHHDEIKPITIEGSLCGAADRISASRPGARVEAAEEYFKRLRKLEDLAYEFPGIEQAYAMQAGREVRIVVMPEMIDDSGILNLARDLSKKIEKEMKYPGKIKVTVIREKRAVEYAV
jgi:ribonucrease Y